MRYPYGKKNEDKHLLAMFKLMSFCDAPHKVYMENGSDQIFQNQQVKESVHGYFQEAHGRSISFYHPPDKEGGVYGMTVPHEMEHSLQSLLGILNIEPHLVEYGAYLAPFLRLPEAIADSIIQEWRAEREHVRAMFKPGSEWLAELAAFSDHQRARNLIVGGIDSEHSFAKGKPVGKIARELLDNFYREHLDLTYTKLEHAAERIIGKTGLD